MNAINVGMAGVLNWFLQSKNYVWAAPILFGLASVAFIMSDSLTRFENITVDWRIKAVADREQAVDERLLFVSIGDQSIETLGRWPWRRDEHEYLLNQFAKYQPRAFCYDILFADLSEHFPQYDIALSNAAANMGVVAFAAHLDKSDLQARRTATDVIDDPNKRVNRINRTDFGFTDPITNVKGASPEMYASDIAILPYSDPENPAKTLAGSGMIGFADCIPDFDGVRRKAPLVVRVGDQHYPSLIVQTLMLYWGLISDDLEVEFGKHLIFHKPDGEDVVVPITEKGELYINWRRAQTQDWDGKGFETKEFADMLAHLNEEETTGIRSKHLDGIEERIIVVGQNSIGLSDVAPTPLEPRTPLPTVHLNGLNTILTGDYIKVVSDWPVLGIWFLTALGSCLLLRTQSIAVSFAVPLVLLVGYVCVAYFMFLQLRVLTPIVGPVLSFGLLHVGAGGVRWLEELKHRLEIRGVFSSYVSGPLLDHLLENPDAIELGGKIRPVSVFFSDIRSFTTISETMESTDLVHKLNEYFEEMVDCVHGHQGTMHKYIGDAIMAVWGDVLDQSEEKSANESVAAALDMRERLDALNKTWEAAGKTPMTIGMGINHGAVTVGNIGAPDRREFTVIGDAVNVAARIESATKQFRTDFLIGENVEKLLNNTFIRRPIGLLVLKGKTKPLCVFEVIDRKKEGTEKVEAWAKQFTEAFDLYLKREFEKAAELFEICLKERDDFSSKSYAESCRELIVNPPGPLWQGVIVLKDK